MTAFILCCFVSADPALPAVDTTTVNRAGVVGIASVSPSTVGLIDEIRLTLTAEGDAPLSVEPIVFANPLGWRLRSTEPPSITEPIAGRQAWRQVCRLTAERPGDLTLPPPVVRVRAGGRETPIEINWQPLTVHVTTTIPRAELDEARGVTGPEPAPPAMPMLWQDERFWAAMIVLVAVVAALLAGRAMRTGPPPELPPSEWAAAELSRLGRLDASDPGAADALAAMLRELLNRRCNLPAPGKNTTEVLGLLRHCSTESSAAWRSLLKRCDLARFAGFGFSAGEWHDSLEAARRLMAETLPVGETTDSATAGSTGENA